MAMEIFWDNRSGISLPDGWENWLTEVIRTGLAYANVPNNLEISVSFVDTDEIRCLNNEYRQIDHETDVLSFPFFEAGQLPPGRGMPIILGDIVICVSVAKLQAVRYNHSLKRELAFLTVHGLLHLLGYDHEEKQDERHMRQAQTDILQKAGILR